MGLPVVVVVVVVVGKEDSIRKAVVDRLGVRVFVERVLVPVGKEDRIRKTDMTWLDRVGWVDRVDRVDRVVVVVVASVDLLVFWFTC